MPSAGDHCSAVFAITTAVVGLGFVFLTPPFQVADEPAHFLRAYEIPEGKWKSDFSNGVGGANLPSSLMESFHPFQRLVFHPEQKTSRAEILAVLKMPLLPDSRRYESFPNTSLYSPLSYLAPAIALAAGRFIGLPALGELYVARIANLIVFVALGTLALRWMPLAKVPTMLLLLMPMTMYLAASVSADTTATALVALTVAQILRLTRREHEMQLHDWVLLVSTTAALGLCKFAYLPLVSLALMIPARVPGNRRRYLLLQGLVWVSGGTCLVAWASQTPGLHARILDRPDVSALLQFENALRLPASFARALVNTGVRDASLLKNSFVGWLGWLDTRLAPAAINCYLILIAVTCWPNRGDLANRSPRWWEIIVMSGASLLAVAAVGLFNYLFWTPLGKDHIEGLQGRYFIPIGVLIVVLLSQSLSSLRRFELPGTGQLWVATAAVGAVLANLYSYEVVFRRYYH